MNHHSILHVVVVLLVVGVGLYIIGLQDWIDATVVKIIRAVVLLAVVLWVLLTVLPRYL